MNDLVVAESENAVVMEVDTGMSDRDAMLATYNASYERRLQYDDMIRKSGDATLGRKLEMDRCRSDIVHWLTHWVSTFDPRNSAKGLPTTVPFDPWPKQIEFLRWLKEREKTVTHGLAEKSRDAGLSFLCCAYALHGWLYREGFTAGFGSHKVEQVDKKGDPKSLFEKIRFMLRLLPKWMLPKGFKEKEHSSQLKLINPANGATITGEGGDNIGRGGRTTLYVIDEAAHLEHPEMIDSSLSMNTDIRIDVSTPNGPGNPFAMKRFGGEVSVFSMKWTDDPRKTQEWYDTFRRVHGPVVTASQVDIDYTASIEGITIPAAWVRAAVNLFLPESGPMVAGLDVGEEGPDLSTFIPRRGPVVKDPISWEKCLTNETAWRAAEHANRLGVTVVFYDAIGVGVGVKSTYNTALAEEDLTKRKRLRFRPQGIISNATPSDFVWPDGITSKERFANLKAELWWFLRCRFEKSYEYLTQGVAHPPEEMISIPDHPQLIAELSLPLHHYTLSGRVQIESKKDMRARGVKSPNFADALAFTMQRGAVTFYPPTLEPEPERRPITDRRAHNPYGPMEVLEREEYHSHAEERGLLGRGRGGR
jgi:phage terminase large subunit